MILSNSERLSLANHLLTLYIYYNDIASVFFFFSEIILYLFLSKNVNRLILRQNIITTYLICLQLISKLRVEYFANMEYR